MSSSKKIAKNTIFLYIRMLLVMGVTLYSSRIILQALGISDYGIYNVVGGIVTMFGFINGAMSSVTQRYISYDIGKGDLNKVQKTFSLTLTIHILIALLILIIGESAGLWYINNQLVFPPERIFAVNVVFQFSLFTLFLNIIQVPYNALILAHERMNVYAYVSIIEVMLKLGSVFLLLKFGNDKLILYSILTFGIALIIRITYQIYCRINFKESKFKLEYDKKYFHELISYSGWNLFGSLSLVGKNQGVNMILNLFFGTTVNAAYGISMQVQAAVTQFVSNFQSALNPQIIQNYAGDNKERSLNLIFLGAKFSFFVMLMITVPVMGNIDYILKLWLGNNVPSYTAPFLKISLIALLVDSMSGPFMTGIHATGKIKTYQIFIGGINLVVPIIVYFILSRGYDASTAFVILLFFSLCSLILRVFFLKKEYLFSFSSLFKKLILPLIIVSLLSFVVKTVLNNLISVNNLMNLFIWLVINTLFLGLIIFFGGIEKNMRIQILRFVRKALKLN
ncbi:lipopolysaccharide biosynthesis protein [Chryseobacterium sp. NRRL B-14859]|uniref:lipopolysaccharide biosynthesis protein n=1 Tax=Chryseobacterium sp. NRRL B-14859 TaxID=1562763 RepID=UPI0033915406